MARWFQNNWSVGAGILLAMGMILVYSLFTHRGEKPYTGLTGVPAVRPGLNSQNTATQSLKDMGLLACADVQQIAIEGCRNTDASHPLEILFDGRNHRVFDARSDSLPATDTAIRTGSHGDRLSDTANRLTNEIHPRELKTDPFIDSSDPRIQDLISDLSDAQGNRILNIKY